MYNRKEKVITLNRVNFHPVHGVQFMLTQNEISYILY
jgi:hypothetical protein